MTLRLAPKSTAEHRNIKASREITVHELLGFRRRLLGSAQIQTIVWKRKDLFAYNKIASAKPETSAFTPVPYCEQVSLLWT